MRKTWPAAVYAAVVFSSFPAGSRAQTPDGPRFEVTIAPERASSPLDGRLLLLLSTNASEEPRFQINDGPNTQLMFGLDVENWRPGAAAVVDASATGAIPLGVCVT